MKCKLMTALLIASLLGCSQGEEHAIYDTDTNPNQFPALAVALLVDLDNGKLTTANSITHAFGELYTSHSELLDDEDWKMVIDRLGGQFGQTADSLGALGMASYTSTGEFYQLASFARPDDPTFRQKALLFATWLEGIHDNESGLSGLTSEAPELVDLVAVTRYFLNSDQTHREFYQTFLTEPIKDLAANNNLLATAMIDQLSPADRELLLTAGLTTP